MVMIALFMLRVVKEMFYEISWCSWSDTSLELGTESICLLLKICIDGIFVIVNGLVIH